LLEKGRGGKVKNGGILVKGRKQIDTSGLLWQSVLDNTGQPRKLA